MPELLDILGQLYGAAWVFVALMLLVDDLVTWRREVLAASDALLDDLGSANPSMGRRDNLSALFLQYLQEEIDRPMPDLDISEVRVG